VLKCDWLVMEPDRGRPYFLEQYELVEEVLPSSDPNHSYAYSLYRKRSLAESLPVPPPTSDLTLTRESSSR
jgi:hypothetical protein